MPGKSIILVPDLLVYMNIIFCSVAYLLIDYIVLFNFIMLRNNIILYNIIAIYYDVCDLEDY